MILKVPSLLAFSIKRLDDKKDFLISLGFNFNEVSYLIKFNPVIFNLSEENIISKVNFFKDKGYSLEETRYILLKLPTIFNYSLDSLEEKLNILKEANLEKEFLNRPSYLMQSSILSFSRLEFLKENGFTLDHKAFNYLLMSSKDFEKKFGISNDLVKERYSLKK